MRNEGSLRRFPIRTWAAEVSSQRSEAIESFNSIDPEAPGFFPLTWSPKQGENWVLRSKEDQVMTPFVQRGQQLSLDNVLCIRKSFFLQAVESSFTDEDGLNRQAFRDDLIKLDTVSSTGELAVEYYLRCCEKRWHNILWRQKLREFRGIGSRHLLFRLTNAVVQSALGRDRTRCKPSLEEKDTSELWSVKKPEPNPISQLLLYKIGDWPIYTILLSLVGEYPVFRQPCTLTILQGQILGGDSCRLTTLSDSFNISGTRLYFLTLVYCITSMMWWKLYRHAEARWVMSLPFFIYAIAVFGMGMAELRPFAARRSSLGGLSAVLYTSAASSSSFFLTENFGHEVGSQVSEWLFRAYFIRGLQQVYFAGLWKIGSQPPPTTIEYLARDGSYLNRWLPYITTPFAIAISLVGLALFKGLPSCYRAIPPSMPAFAPAMIRRRTILVGNQYSIRENEF